MSSNSEIKSKAQMRTYERAQSVVFSRTKETFGGLSNMAAGFPVRVNGVHILTSEALYQACRFPHLPEVQRLIIRQPSPMTAKMKGKPYRKDSRPDWDRVRVKIMRWCLRVKLAQNWRKFSELLISTGARAIVEESRKDDFWGAKVIGEDTLIGMNVLGRLLMELREEVAHGDSEQHRRVEPLPIPDFLLYGEPILVVGIREATIAAAPHSSLSGEHGVSPYQGESERIPKGRHVEQPSLFDIAYPVGESSATGKTMVDGLKPYPEYKESGVPWLSRVPVHWTVSRIKTVLRELDYRSADGSGVLLSLTRLRGLIPHSDMTNKMHSAKTLAGYKRYRPGQIVMNRMQAWSGMFGAGSMEGLVSPDYAVFEIFRAHQVKLVLERLKAPDLVGQFALESKGIGSGFNRLYTDRFGPIPISLPPADEQAAIMQFVDHANRRLEQTIRAKRKVIALLNEQKQAIILRAVTRGLDPTVSGKPSGTPWFDDIPSNCQRTRLGRVCVSIRDGTHNPPPAVPGVHRLLSVRNIIGGRFVTRLDDRTMTPVAFVELQRSYTVQAGDVVIALVGATTGKSAVVEQMENVTVQRSLGILRPNRTLIDSDFLNLLIMSNVIQDQIRRIMDKYAAQPGIYLQELGGLQVIYPSVEEQLTIVARVKAETALPDQAISRTEREIALLREYRTRLIADVVTGKLDVREAARHLRVEADEPASSVPGDEVTEEAEAIEEEQFT